MMDPAPSSPHHTASSLPPLPLVGRSSELAMLSGLLDAAEKGRGTTLFLEGEGGQGKTRLALATGERAAKHGWLVAIGRAYPVEVGVPYALFADALLPVLRTLDSAALSVLTRGADLSHVFPMLAGGGGPIRSAGDQGSEVKTRLLWNFAQLIARLAQKRPLLLILENLHWADESSLEMLHFTARQLGASRVLVIGTYNASSQERAPALVSLRQSLVGLGAARVHHLEPLSRAATDELIQEVFGVSDAVSREFAALLYGWTRGNPFFVEETLKALVTSGRLYQRDGMWHGWEIADIDLPRSIREAVVARLDRLSADAQRVAAMAAVIGTRASYDALDAVVGMPRSGLVEAIDELRAQHILEERREGDRIVYDFSHPILRDVIYQEMGLARARLLHATVADALERHYAGHADEHADELAYHFARADARDVAPKAARYLALAGRNALARHANREAASYLTAALELTRDAGSGDAAAQAEIIEGLARARQRLGEYEAAVALWERAREHAQRSGDLARLADIERRLGLAAFWRGRHDEALERYEAALGAATAAGVDSTVARARLARGMCLQELGRAADAEREVADAIAIADRLGDASLLARAHRTQLLFYLWTGRTELAYKHAERARELAAASGQKVLEWLAQWALATLSGLTGASEACARHLAEAERLAEDLDSPVFRTWTAEIAIELASATGEWEKGLALAERTIALGRGVGLRAPFPRLLVWAAIMHIGRGEFERAKAYIDEAWELSGASRGAERPRDVHSVVPAHIGLAAYHLFTGNFAEAIRVGEAGLAIADQAGASVWAVHRLLPILAESALEARDLRRAEKIGTRLRLDSQRLGQRAGLAWADACAALVAMLRGETEDAIVLLRNAAAALEAVPVVSDAARVRRQLARVLAESGDREGATRELRRVHEIFVRLGADRELALARQQLRELGARPPARAGLPGAEGLTARELEIVRLVTARKSNKEIGQALNISPRTVSTHLTNVFTKLGVGSRGELADFVRERELFTG